MNTIPNTNHRIGLLQAATLQAGAALLPLASQTQDAGGWKTAASVYVYLPSVSGQSAFPTDGRSPIEVGAGGSTTTWQAAAGVAYGFEWGELSALYRSLDYDMQSGKAIQNIRFSGPMVGATFRW